MTEYLPELEEWGIKITCPDCGELFELTQHGNCYCKRCKRIFTEAEVRRRCGI